MNEIIPALMPKNYDDLADGIGSVAGLVPVVQIDVMDGAFVPNSSWPYAKGIPKPSDAHFARIVSEQEGMPRWEDVDAELDLMIETPEETIEQWIATGARRIIVHLESVKDAQKLFLAMESARGIVEFGLSIGNDTPNGELEKYADDIDFVQFMGIAEIGFQSQPFDERVFEKISDFRANHPDMPISVDGAVSAETIERLSRAGATRFVAGSAVFGGGVIAENIETLAAKVNT